MKGRNTVLRAADALSLAAWFGGSLMGATGLPRAAEAAGRRDVEGAAWSAYQPLQTGAIALQLASGAALLAANKGRVAGQRGVASLSLARTALTGAALGATVLAARSGRRLEEQTRDRTADEANDGDGALERRTRALQWAVPALTGALLAVDAAMGEQQRPSQVARGAVLRLLPDQVADRLAA
jgi:hypothetical protein